MNRLSVTAAALALLAAPALAEDFQQIKIDAGAQLFANNCRRCHSTDADRKSYGPLLEGVVGRRAGSVEGFPYSEALKNSGIVWTDAALRAWMEDNTGFLPGTRMRHVGIDDRTVQDFILAYLHSIAKN
jgi:cytochrome c